LGVYAARILNGEAPGDLLIQVVIKFELVINLTVAKAIGLELPAR
jgi:putative ABC transport system substrate-binding protein